MRALLLALAAPLAFAGDGTVVAGDLGAALDRDVERASGGTFWGAVLVAKGGETLLAKGYGMADYAKRPNTPRTLFEIASTSKSFTAAAILKLEMEGKLRIDDPIAKHLKGVPKDKRGITIHHVLTHTSGLSPHVGVPYASTMSRPEFLRFVLSKPLESPPGERFAYCNSAYALLAALVEEVTGKTFEEYSRKKLFEPAGLVDTGFIGDKALDGGRVTVRREGLRPGATASDWFWGWGYRGMGGVVTTAEDLLRWDRALRGDAVLDAKARERWTTPFLEGYACGWQVATTDRGTTKVEHSGGVAGYGVNYVRYLEDDAVVIVLSNTNPHTVSAALEERLFPPAALSLSIDVEGYALSEYRAAQFEGTAAWRVEKEGGGILLALEEGERKRAVATLRLPGGVAAKLRADLAALAAKRPQGAPERMDSGLYLLRYTLEGGKLELDDGLRLAVMPSYRGQGKDGKPVVDDRITLVVMDGRRGQWPVMAKMDAKSAQALLAALDAALK